MGQCLLGIYLERFIAIVGKNACKEWHKPLELEVRKPGSGDGEVGECHIVQFH